MAPSMTNRPANLRFSALAFATLSLAPLSAPSLAQTVYREYEDGGVGSFSDEDDREFHAAPLRRAPPRAFDEDDDERFERDDEDGAFDDDDLDDDGDDRQGRLDLAPRSSRQPAREAAKTPPTPPPSVDAKPAEKAWKPAL